MQPQSFKSNETHGILENGLMKIRARDGQFTIPTDWYFLLFYHIEKKDLFGTGEIQVKSWVSKYDQADVEQIEKKFQPTGTYYESDAIQEEKEQKVEKIIK